MHVLPCFCTCIQNSQIKENKKTFKILEKDVYVTPEQIFETFMGIVDI